MATSSAASRSRTAKSTKATRESAVADAAAAFGTKHLKQAAKKVGKASSELVEWSKDHPVKAAAAGAALIAVTTTIYATMRAIQKSKARGRK